MKKNLGIALGVAVGVMLLYWWQYTHDTCPTCQAGSDVIGFAGGSRYGTYPGGGPGIPMQPVSGAGRV